MENKIEEVKLSTEEISPKKGETIQQEVSKEAPMRRIVIETNGADIKLTEAQVAGTIELVAILNAVIGFVSKNLNK